MPDTPPTMPPPPPKRRAGRPSRPDPETNPELVEALWTTDEPIPAIAARFGRSKQGVYWLYDRLCAARGGPPPTRRVNRDAAHAAAAQATVGDRIAAARLARGISQRTLAAKVDPPCQQSSIGRSELAGDAVDPDFLARIARALECDPCDLDARLAPSGALTLARVGDPAKGVGWEPLREADRARMDGIWSGDGPTTADLGRLVDAAVGAGMAVVIRSDLGVRVEDGGGSGS